MAKARAEITIEKSADEVWARIRDFGEISWTPNVASCTLKGNDRTITMGGANFELVERMDSHDDENRCYSYHMVGELDLQPLMGPGNVLRHLAATLSVTPSGDSDARVTWDIDTEDFFVEGTRAEYQGALDNLKAELEA